ncbi:MAG: hypothetical protein MZV64_23675 [Ignavibacteriales bacterium]|nr:hypothetical protein [Ignavibacteriales bacterium]
MIVPPTATPIAPNLYTHGNQSPPSPTPTATSACTCVYPAAMRRVRAAPNESPRHCHTTHAAIRDKADLEADATADRR